MKQNRLIFFINLILITVTSNGFLLFQNNTKLTVAFVIAFIIVNFTPSLTVTEKMSKRLRICWHGTSTLKLFRISVLISLIIHINLAFLLPFMWLKVLFSALVCTICQAVFFWNGMIALYISSVQLGIRERVVGALCGMIPIVNLVVLNRMLRITSKEVAFELEKEKLNDSRKNQQLCKTKYPILMVHGVFFRDFKQLNYWGRIPAELEKNGATVYYGNHHSAASVADCAKELADRIKEIVETTGCEKLNVIAHSKGGLDMRYAMEYLGVKEYVASIMTVNTPHRGCKFADYLLDIAPDSFRESVANTYNSTFSKLGDEEPDFISAVTDLTSEKCTLRDSQLPMPQGVYCLSVGSKINKATSGKFPLNVTYHLVNLFDGPNDGLVGADSFKWGENYEFLCPKGERGISHGDMIDLNRENIDDFDVREYYVKKVNNLKEMGL